MTDPLVSARLKLKRAVEHLDALDREVRAFADAEVERIRAQGDPEIPEPIHPVWLAMKQPPFEAGAQFRGELPSRFGVILGDFLGNLRAALDHAVNGVAGANAGDYTKFPVFTDPDKFAKAAKDDLKGVPKACRELIERMQPYHGHRRGERLLLLRNLRNLDNHRVLHPAFALIYQGVWNHPHGVMESTRSFRDKGVLGDEAEVHITFLGPDRTPRVEGGAPYQLAFSDGSARVVASRIDFSILLDEVRAIVAEIGGKPTMSAVAAALYTDSAKES